MAHASHGCGILRGSHVTGIAWLAFVGVALISPVAAAPPEAGRSANAQSIANGVRPSDAQYELPAPSTETSSAVLWSHACAVVAEVVEWYDLPFPSRASVLRSGLDTVHRALTWRRRYRTLEARLRIGLAEALLESADISRRQQVHEHARNALTLLEPAREGRSHDAALLAARAHLALARWSDTAEVRIRFCRQALADLEDADRDDPRSSWLAGQCHLTLAEALAFEGADFSRARDHYRRALPALYRLRHAGARGAEGLARWHADVARLTWREGNPTKAEEHASMAQSLYREADGWSRRVLLDFARGEQLLGQIAVQVHGSPETAAEHLGAAWQAYERQGGTGILPVPLSSSRNTGETPVPPGVPASKNATSDGFNRVACGVQFADLLIATGDVEGGLTLLQKAVADGNPSAAVIDRVLGYLARSTVIEEHGHNRRQAHAEVRKAFELAVRSGNLRERRLAALWATTRQAEMRSIEEPPQTVAADLRRGLEANRPPAPASAEEALAEARALHLLANLEAATPENDALADRHYREALSAYRQALRQGAGSAGELGTCYLDMALLRQLVSERPDDVLSMVRQAIRHLSDTAPQEPENWNALAQAHLTAATATTETGGSPAVALGHLESAVAAARTAVGYEQPGAHAQLARLLARRGHWELEKLDGESASSEAARAREMAISWYRDACATYRLGRELDPGGASPLDEIPCRATLAGLLWEHDASYEAVAEQLAIARELLDGTPEERSDWCVERARLDQFEADLLLGRRRKVRQAAVRLESAVHQYEQALSLAEAEHAPSSIRNTYTAELEVALFNLADFYATYLGDAGGAAEWFRRNLALQKQMALGAAERQANESLVLMRLGLVESQLRGDPDRAAEYYESARERLNQARAAGVSDAELVVRTLVGLGMLGGQLPGYEREVEKHFTDAAELARRHEGAASRLAGFEYSARHGLAMQYERSGRFRAAAGQMHRCLELGRDLGLESLAEDRAYLEALTRLAQSESNPSGDPRR